MYISLATSIMDSRLQLVASALEGASTTTQEIGSSSSSLSSYVSDGNFTVVLYSGTIPTNADTALSSSNTTLASIVIPTSEVGIPTNGTLTISGEPLTSSPATTTGTASFARIYNPAGNVVMDCDVGISGTTFILVSTAITEGLVVTITAMSFSEYNS